MSPGAYGIFATLRPVRGSSDHLAAFDLVGAGGRLCGSRCVLVAFDGTRPEDWAMDPWAAAADAIRQTLELMESGSTWRYAVRGWGPTERDLRQAKAADERRNP